jgi:hypothetical protein
MTRLLPTSPRYINPCVHREIDLTPKKLSVLLEEDGAVRVIVERVAIKRRCSFCTVGYVKSKADLYNITSQ